MTRLDGIAAAVAGAALLAMMALTVADVLGRYLLGQPVRGAFEITELLMAVTIFAALPSVSARGRHIAITLLEERLPPAPRRALTTAVELIAATALAVAAWRLSVLASDFAAYGEVTSHLRLPLAPFAWFAAMGCALAAAGSAACAIRGTPRGAA